VDSQDNLKRHDGGAAEASKLSSFELLPAIDVSHGMSVRLTSGDQSTQESFGSPLEIATSWINAGTTWIHLVDLDAAYGNGENQKLISQVVSSVSGVKVQVSGGIRDQESFVAALSTGAARINLSTSALTNLSWVESVIAKHGNLVSVALDVSGSRLVARGTKEDVGELAEAMAQLEQFGCARYVVTDINKDGSLTGPNIELLESVLEMTNKPVIASGGISELSDLEALVGLKPKGLAGAILGKALYVGRFSLELEFLGKEGSLRVIALPMTMGLHLKSF
jgi:phosphoribosylformimino-5-aminoimidazole carboxamide ribotide isomerase/phosphoribosylanthranilate isomerase